MSVGHKLNCKKKTASFFVVFLKSINTSGGSRIMKGGGGAISDTITIIVLLYC